MKMSPMAYKIYQSSFTILPSTKYTLKILPKTWKILPKWRNFTKSGKSGLPMNKEKLSTFLNVSVSIVVVVVWAN